MSARWVVSVRRLLAGVSLTRGECTLLIYPVHCCYGRLPLFGLNQLLVKDFTIDSITAKAQLTTFAPGVDYMADYDEWLFIQVSEIITIRRP